MAGNMRVDLLVSSTMKILLFLASVLVAGACFPFPCEVNNSEGRNEVRPLYRNSLTAVTTSDPQPHPLSRVKREQCGGDIHDTTGVITSPLFPNYYKANIDCTWNIIASPTEGIILNFTNFQLEHHENCSSDHVEVYTADGATAFGTHGRFCGFEVPNVISSVKSIVVHFKTDPHTEFSGFSAVYRKVFVACIDNNGGCKHICGRGLEGKPLCSCRSGFVLHPDDHNCPEEYSVGKVVQLTSQTHPNGSLIFSWKWRDGAAPSTLTGFYFKGTSPEHTFQMTLPPELTNLTVGHLRSYTEYDFTLWPIYDVEGAPSEKLGKPIMVSVRTPASVPMAPKAVGLWPQSTGLEPGQLALSIIGPLAWNSKPVGFRVLWTPAYANGGNEGRTQFKELVRSADGNKYDVNLTLSLKPGRIYNISARACGLGDFGEIIDGPETLATFGTVPLAPTNLASDIADPTSALLRWDGPGPAQRYEVTVSWQNFTQEDDMEASFSVAPSVPLRPLSFPKDENEDSEHSENHADILSDHGSQNNFLDQQGSSEIVIGKTDRNIINVTIWVDGSSLTSSSYSLPVFGLSPDRNYAVYIRACAADACSQEASMALRTPPSSIAAPVITRISSSDSSSIHLQWSLPSLQSLLMNDDLEFEVRAYKDAFFQLIPTTLSALTISNLSSATEYAVEVRASLMVAAGRRKYSKPARTVISTRPLVPMAPTLSTMGFDTAPDVIAVSWGFVNSTVENVEVATNGSSFLNCKISSTCDIVVLHGWNSSYKAGFVKMSGLSPYQGYAVSLRGCNDNGCGDATTVYVTTGISEPSEPLDLQVSSEDNVTVNFEWKSPSEPAGPLTGYLVSWQCENGPIMAATTSECFLTFPGLPPQLENCSFSVCAYNLDDDGGELYGKTATLTKLSSYG